MTIAIHTIGFTQSTAEHFFQRLKDARVERLIDVRLNNVSQLAGFSKRDDLAFFLRTIVGADYVHELLLAPEEEALKSVRGGKVSWTAYERAYLAPIKKRRIEKTLDRTLFDKRAVLLCSEAKPDHCHRRIAAEYLRDKWGGITITHL